MIGAAAAAPLFFPAFLYSRDLAARTPPGQPARRRRDWEKGLPISQ